jgi:MOSC domain-containing protein YiiM
MKLISVNVGLPREVEWKGKLVSTGIFKSPVDGRVALRRLNLDGDRQADLSVHGGPEKAVYAYPSEHYAFWKEELSGFDLPWGVFGENFTIEGLIESEVRIGDLFRIGTAVVEVTQPRMPCYKLALRFGRDDMIRRFLASGRTGFYFAVRAEGGVGAGDAIEALEPGAQRLTVADVVALYRDGKNDAEGLRRAVATTALTASWRDYFRARLEKLEHPEKPGE